MYIVLYVVLAAKVFEAFDVFFNDVHFFRFHYRNVHGSCHARRIIPEAGIADLRHKYPGKEQRFLLVKAGREMERTFRKLFSVECDKHLFHGLAGLSGSLSITSYSGRPGAAMTEIGGPIDRDQQIACAVG